MTVNLTTLRGTPAFGAAKFNNGLTSGVVGTAASTSWDSAVGTFEAWVKVTGGSSIRVAVGNNGSAGNGLWIGVDGSGFAARGTPTNASSASALGSIADGNFHHLALTVDGSAIKFWVDGQLGINTASTVAFTMGAGSNAIGGWGASTFNDWVGVVDEVRISNVVRYTTAFTPPTTEFTVDANTTALYHLEANGNDAVVPTMTVAPTVVPNGHAGNMTLTLTGSGTSWSGGTTFTISGVTGATKVSQNVASATSATVVITTSTGTGTLTVSDGSISGTTTVSVPTLAISPTTGNTGTTPTVTLTGTNTVWAQETAAGLFSVSGGTGASIGTPTVSTNTSATAALTVGSAGGTLTVTDNSTGKTATFTASATSLTPSPAVIPNGHAGNITITLTGVGTSWTGGTTFTVSGVANVTKVSQNVASGTSATVVVTTGAGSGTLTISDGTLSNTVSVAVPTLAVSPTSANTGTVQAVTLTGTNTVWTQETASTLFTVSGGTGASIASISVASATSATANLTVGSAGATLTLTDASTGKTASFTAVAPPVSLAVTSSALYWSPWNWRSDGAGAMQSNNVRGSSTNAWSQHPGAYVKMAFTTLASGTASITVDPANLSGVLTGNGPKLAWSVDGGALQTQIINFNASPQTISLASGLSAGAHTIFVWFRSFSVTVQGDRLTTDPPQAALKITGFTLSGGSTAGTPAVKAKRALIYGDSITEGDLVLSSFRDANSMDGLQTWAAMTAHGLDAEVGVVGFFGANWQNLADRWNIYTTGVSRLISGALSPAPDYILINYGTNLTGGNTATVTATLAAISAAAPSARIFVIVPFGGYFRSSLNAATLPPRTTIIDTQLDTGDLAALSLVWTAEGIHLNASPGQAMAATKVVAKIRDAIDGTGFGNRI